MDGMDASPTHPSIRTDPPPTHIDHARSLDDVGRKPARMRVEAGEEERAALAERFEFMNMHHLSANVSLSRPRWGCVHRVVRLRSFLGGRTCCWLVCQSSSSWCASSLIGFLPPPGRCWWRARCGRRWTGTAS